MYCRIRTTASIRHSSLDRVVVTGYTGEVRCLLLISTVPDELELEVSCTQYYVFLYCRWIILSCAG